MILIVCYSAQEDLLRAKAVVGGLIISMLAKLKAECRAAGEEVDKRRPWIDMLVERVHKITGSDLVKKRRTQMYNYIAFAELAREFPYLLYTTLSFTSITRAVKDVREGCALLNKRR